MRRLGLLAALAAIAASIGCASVDVSVDYDQEEDFSVYRSFDWLPVEDKPGNPRVDNPVVNSRMRSALETTLTEKGFQKVDTDPDFYVHYHLSLEEKTDFYTVNHYYGTVGWVMSVPKTEARHYQAGTLVIDIGDAREMEVVWRGVGQGELRAGATPEETTKAANRAVAEILKDFPPTAD